MTEQDTTWAEGPLDLWQSIGEYGRMIATNEQKTKKADKEEWRRLFHAMIDEAFGSEEAEAEFHVSMDKCSVSVKWDRRMSHIKSAQLLEDTR